MLPPSKPHLDFASLLFKLFGMKRMRHAYRTVTIPAILIIALAASTASGASGDVLVKGMLSTGRTFDGKLLRDDGRRFSVKESKRTSTFMSVNIVECTVKVEGEKNLDVSAGLGGGLPKFLLTKGHNFLAEATFLCYLTRSAQPKPDGELTLHLWAMEQTPREKILENKQIDAVKAMYAKLRRKPPVRLGGKKTSIWRPRRYRLPPPAIIAKVMEQADQWGAQMKKIAPKTHRVETDHFIIFSAWRKSDDAKLKGIYEKLYAGLCKQFDIPPTENIWIGKLPVFAFWDKKSYVTFSISVCGTPPTMAQQAAGFAGTRGPYQFVNLGPVMAKGISKTNAQLRFYSLLVHESTHAFLNRYINSKRIPSWLNEGIAEMISATFVPKGDAPRKLKAANTLAKKGKAASLMPMFTARNIPLAPEAYGAAQSMTRFLIFRSKSKFIQLVYRIKEGVDSDKALAEVYGLSHKKLLQTWIRSVR